MSKWALAILTLILGIFTGASFDRIAMQAPEGIQTRLQSCEAKFTKQTILYDGALFQGKRWIIPAEITPIYIGNGLQAAYTHFDPATAIETVKLQPKAQR